MKTSALLPLNVPEKLVPNLRVAIVHACWHMDVVNPLIEGATQCAQHAGLSSSHVETFAVHGTYEVAQLVSALAKTKRYNAIVALGCVIKGETNHYDLICDTLAQSLTRTSETTHVAIGFGVVSSDTFEQALARAGGEKGNKGHEAMAAALDLAVTMDQIS